MCLRSDYMLGSFVVDNECLVCVSHSLLLCVDQQVMKETDTQVKWPSKLKIGAKSKKGDSFF